MKSSRIILLNVMILTIIGTTEASWHWQNRLLSMLVITECSEPLIADLNDDCYVEYADLGIFVGQWLESDDPNDCSLSAELSGDDCEVRLSDFVVLFSLWLQCGNPVDTECIWMSPTQCHGDADGDGWVYSSDIAILDASWLQSYPNPLYDSRADFSRDGIVDNIDFFEWLYWYSKYPPGDCPIGYILWPGSWSSPTQCYGDVDGDYDVDDDDVNIFNNSYMYSYGQLDYNPSADFDRDGDVDLTDLNTLSYWYYFVYPPQDCSVGGTWPPLP